MIMRSLQPSYARHLIGVSILDYRALIKASYGIEDGMVCDLWSDSSSSDSKGKKPSASYRLEEVGAISSFQYRPSIPPQLLRLPAPYTPPHPVYAPQVMERPPTSHLKPRAPTVPT